VGKYLMDNTIIDLDLLRPEQRFVILNKKKIDISFIPCGITFDIDTLIRDMSSLKQDEVLKGGAETLRAFDMGIKLCSTFCSAAYPELDEKWFRKNTNPQQVQALSEEIRRTLFAGYEQVAGYTKNGEAVKEEV